ncbi:transposase [Streptomyces sp. NPDC007076]|uniref:transposase n=1 Tax=unclassified Streptomyces TaxID=2593676 RepID=UPI00339840C1
MTKSARRLAGFNERVLSLCACGMPVRDMHWHLADVYGVEVSPDPVRSPAPVTDELAAWQNRPLVAV